ncbi:hypothetical protein LAZ67_9001955 [Cordylochernes scorpioides]|uniref:Reverse transcriptase Ty1/copia-type domain-containing protein n=1 Tax=Cordylochernes scorpioides TaxID=51811 RepID=A0ABY6KU38_9ARAC|nr:hypothetical protein LAZ67_9001955 [Cordylochernes scorpioides]
MGLEQMKTDNCVYIKREEGVLLVAIYVDDMIIAAEEENTLICFKESMKKLFEINDLGALNYCLGIRVQRGVDGSISLDQERYIEELLEKYEMKESKPISTPMDPNYKVTKISPIDACSPLLEKNIGPKITFKKSTKELYGYVDADWGGNLMDRKSHSGFVFYLAGGPIAWESKKQQTVSLSSTESEYIALCEAGKEAVHIRMLLDELGFGEILEGPTVLRTDNQGARQLTRNPVYHARTKHIDIKWHYIRDIYNEGLVEVVQTPTQENVADVFTKSLTKTYELIKEAFGDTALSRSRTFEWFSRFLKGREKINDDQHTGRPRSLRCEENKLKIKELIKSNRIISIKDLSSETGLSVGLCHQIVTKDLDMIRTSSKFAPRILTEEQKEVRMDVCKNMVEMTRTDSEWMQKIITGDETWVYQYDPETKRQSSQ